MKKILKFPDFQLFMAIQIELNYVGFIKIGNFLCCPGHWFHILSF